MSDRIQAQIVFTDAGASATARKIGTELERMGKIGESAAKQASRGLADLDKQAQRTEQRFTALGAAAGTIAGVLAKGGQAAVTQAREVDLLGRVYKGSADAILAYTQRLEDSSNF